MAGDEEVGFEEGMLWIPTQVLDEACEASSKELRPQKHQQPQHGLIKSPATAEEQLPLMHTKPAWLKPHQRQRNPTNWTAGGPGMQAIFLDSRQRSCGTGVFLPRTPGIDFQLPTKPACSPVLLPSRVVQALNLNVHELGSQIKPQDVNIKSKSADQNSIDSKKGNDVFSRNQSCSPEIFLPKEWTY